MQDKLQQLKTRLAEVHDLMTAASVLEWDQETQMADGGVQGRAHQLATLRSLAHQKFVDEEVGTLLEDLHSRSLFPPESHEAAIIRVGWRNFQKQIRVPSTLVAAIEEHSSFSLKQWQQARAEDDWAHFQPALEKMVDLKLQYAACLAEGEDDKPYDILLSYYDEGTSSAAIRAVFDPLKPEIVALVEAIQANHDRASDAVMRRHYPHDGQIAFSKVLASALGYDFNRGHITLATHPFSISFSSHDVRITTRVNEAFLPTCLMGTIHESGHAMYDQGADLGLYRIGVYPDMLGGGSSMSIHESQSRFYENVLGRSKAFWKHFFPQAQAAFPESLSDVSVEDFYKALNTSAPSLIRVEADEVTYGLHIMLRFELEDDLINGRVKVADLPREWNDRMEAYLGVRPATNKEGVLQDIHWSMGLMGYFPGYLLGSIFAVQFWETMQAQLPGVVEDIERGEFAPIREWLREKIHQHGCKFSFPETVERVTGGPLTWEPYIRYLKEKYGEVYGL